MLAGIFGIPSVTRLSFGVMEASWAESTSDTAAATNSASASRGPIDLISRLLCRILTGISIAQAISVQTHVNLPKAMNARPAKRSITARQKLNCPPSSNTRLGRNDVGCNQLGPLLVLSVSTLLAFTSL